VQNNFSFYIFGLLMYFTNSVWDSAHVLPKSCIS